MKAVKENQKHPSVWLVGLILMLGTLACYWRVRTFDFINLDDPLYVYRESMIQKGFSWPGFVWSFHSINGGNWNPLIWLSHMADCQFFGLAPEGHHVTNLLLHMLNVWLLFLLRKTTRSIQQIDKCGKTATSARLCVNQGLPS